MGRKTPAIIRMHQNRRLARSLQHKATLIEEERRHNNTVIPDAPLPALQLSATQPQFESLNLLPRPAADQAPRTVRLLRIVDQQSA
jgi:hypothetical protein